MIVKLLRFALFSLFAILLMPACSTVYRTGGEVTTKGGFSKEDQLRTDIVEYARKHLGTRYRYAGRDPSGFDCSGLTYYVMKNFDIPLAVRSQDQAREGRKISVREARQGDLIFFKRSQAGQVFHVAMVVANNGRGLQVIHSTSRGVVVDNISESDYWRPKVSSARNVIVN